MSREEQGYDWGFRVGTFDKCNGRPERDFGGIDLDDDYNHGYANGYVDGWVTNEVRICA